MTSLMKMRDNACFSNRQQTLVTTSLLDDDDDDDDVAMEMTCIEASQAAQISRFTASKHDTVLLPSETFSLLLTLHTPSTCTNRPHISRFQLK